MGQGDAVRIKLALDLGDDRVDLGLQNLGDLAHHLLLGLVVPGDGSGDLIHGLVVSVLDGLGDVETEIIAGIILVLHQAVAVELQIQHHIVAAGEGLGLGGGLRVGGGSEDQLNTGGEVGIGDVSASGLGLDPLIHLLGDGGAQVLGDLGLVALQGGVAVLADLDGGVGDAIHGDVDVAADVGAVAVMEVGPQRLALALHLVQHLGLDLAQGLVGENDAALLLHRVLDAGEEALHILGGGSGVDAVDEVGGELGGLLDDGDHLAFIHADGSLHLYLTGVNRGIAGGEVGGHMADAHHTVDGVLDLLELAVGQIAVLGVHVLHGLDDGPLQGIILIVHLIHGGQDSVAHQVIGVDRRRVLLPDRVQGQATVGGGQRDGAAGGVLRLGSSGSSAARPAQEGVALAGGNGAAHGEGPADGRGVGLGLGRGSAGTAVGVIGQGISIIGGLLAGTAGAAAAVALLHGLGAVNQAGQTVDHSRHMGAGRQGLGTEGAVGIAVDQAPDLALLHGVHGVSGDLCPVGQGGRAALFGHGHVVLIRVVVQVTLNDGAHLGAGDGVVGGELAVALAFHDLLGRRPVDGAGAPGARLHVGKRALAVVYLRTVKPGQNHHEHRAGHVPVRREGRVGGAEEVAFRGHIVYVLIAPAVPADIREIVRVNRQRCGRQGKDEAQCQQST